MKKTIRNLARATALLLFLSSPSPTHADKLINDVIDWVRTLPNGYFNDKLVINPMGDAPFLLNSETSSAPMGVYAKEDIAANELLMRVPKEAYIQVWDKQKQEDDSWDVYYYNMCLLVQELREEMSLGYESTRGPYIRFLKNQDRGQIPAMWSTSTKNILRTLLPTELEEGGISNSVDWIDDHFKKTSCISSIDPFEEHLVALVKQRGYDAALIPLWDMVNHHNGPRLNTNNTSIYENAGVQVYAARDIGAGEEIFASYDMCHDCASVAAEWGTPEMFRDFGFVEGYPHRYHYPEEEIWFEVLEAKNDSSSEDAKMVVRWDDHIVWPDGDSGNYGAPEEEELEFMEDELVKFSNALESLSDVPDHEKSAVVQFIQTSIVDLTLAIEEGKKAQNKRQEIEGENATNDDDTQNCVADGMKCDGWDEL